MAKEKMESGGAALVEPNAGITGRAVRPVDASKASPEAREARMKDAQERQAADPDRPSPVHRFKIHWKDANDGGKEYTETIGVPYRHKHQAELEARARFNDKLPRKTRRPNPREVDVEYLGEVAA